MISHRTHFALNLYGKSHFKSFGREQDVGSKISLFEEKKINRIIANGGKAARRLFQSKSH